MRNFISKGVEGVLGPGWLRASAILALLSAGLVCADMALRIHLPSYTLYELGRIPYIGRGCVRGFVFSRELAFMNMELTAFFAVLFLLMLGAAAASVYACGGYRLPALAVAACYDLFSLFTVVFVLAPVIGLGNWSGPALFDAGFAGGILAALCGAYGVTELAVEESISSGM